MVKHIRILEAIGNLFPYSMKEIEQVFDGCGSYDSTIGFLTIMCKFSIDFETAKSVVDAVSESGLSSENYLVEFMGKFISAN